MMRVNVNIISFGKKAQDIMYKIKFLEQRKNNKNDQIVRMYNSFTDEHEDEMDCFCHQWGDAYKRYVVKRVDNLLSSGDVNIVIVTRGVLETFSQVLHFVGYGKRTPIYVVLISDNNDAALSVEFRKEVKMKSFSLKNSSDESFALNLDFLIDKLVQKRYMTFSQFMKSDLRKEDPFDNYKFVYIPKFILQIREDV